MDENMCEGYVTLGRLNHVKMRHARDAQRLRDALDERVEVAYDSATERVRGEYEALQTNLQRLYQKSLSDLDAHKAKVEDPTHQCLKVIDEQLQEIKKAEANLKGLLGDLDEERFTRELPRVTDQVNGLLASSRDLESIPYPKATLLSESDFPAGRLHNVVIAPKRSGDRGRKNISVKTDNDNTTTASQSNSSKKAGNDTRINPAAGAASGKTSGSGSSSGSNPVVASSMRWVPVPVARVPSAEEQAGSHAWEGEEGRGGAAASGDDAAGSGSIGGFGGANPAWQWQGRSQRAFSAGAAVEHGQTAEACGSCACACRKDDVWAAYRTLRARYRVLKENVDEEELRLRVDECRRTVEEEFHEQRRAMESELQKAQEEIITLRGVAQDSRAECKARQRDAIVMRDQVLRAQRGLEEALRDARDAKEEINRRKQQAELLLGKLRFLQGQTTACAEAVAFMDHDIFDSQMEDDYANSSSTNGSHIPRQQYASPSTMQRHVPPSHDNHSLDTDQRAYSAINSSMYDNLEDDTSDMDNGESMDLSGSRRGGLQTDLGGSGVRRDLREEERRRRRLSREVRRVSAQLSHSVSVATSEDSGDYSSDGFVDSNSGTKFDRRPRGRHGLRSRNESTPEGHYGPGGESQGTRRRNGSALTPPRRHADDDNGAGRHQQQQEKYSEPNSTETSGTGQQQSRARRRSGNNDQDGSRNNSATHERGSHHREPYPPHLNLGLDSQESNQDSVLHNASSLSLGFPAGADTRDAAAESRNVTNHSRNSASSLPSSSASHAGKQKKGRQHKERLLSRDARRLPQLSIPTAESDREQDQTVAAAAAALDGPGGETQVHRSRGGLPKPDTGGRGFRKYTAFFARSLSTGARSWDGRAPVAEPRVRAWTPGRSRRARRAGRGEGSS